MQDGQTTAEGEKIANDLLKKLGLAEAEKIPGAYMDLIIAATDTKSLKNGH